MERADFIVLEKEMQLEATPHIRAKRPYLILLEASAHSGLIKGPSLKIA